MQAFKTLIDKASQTCGGDADLCRKLGIAPPTLSQMRSGVRKISPATAAELADIAGDDAREAAIAAVIESAKGTRREGALREILGKALAAGVVGLLAFSYKSDLTSTTDGQQITLKTSVDISNQRNCLYIVSNTIRGLGNRIYRLYGFVRDLMTKLPAQVPIDQSTPASGSLAFQ